MSDGVQNLLINIALSIGVGLFVAFIMALGTDKWDSITTAFWMGAATVPFWKMVEGMTSG